MDQQADNLYNSLPIKEMKLEEYLRRLFFESPAPAYERIKEWFDPYKRYNNHIAFNQMFPDSVDGLCSCGCGKPVKKAKKNWASNECQKYAIGVWLIITGNTQYIGGVLKQYTPDVCVKCGASPCEADHIVPVNRGGGGSWLSNFQFLCKECHKIKTREDNGWVQLKKPKK